MLQEQRGDRRVMMFAFIKLAPSIVTTFPAKYKFKLNPIRPSSLNFIKFCFSALYKRGDCTLRARLPSFLPSHFL